MTKEKVAASISDGQIALLHDIDLEYRKTLDNVSADLVQDCDIYINVFENMPTHDENGKRYTSQERMHNYVNEYMQPYIDAFNDKQKRKDRKIDVPYVEWHNKQRHPGRMFFEHVLQYGSNEEIGKKYYSAVRASKDETLTQEERDAAKQLAAELKQEIMETNHKWIKEMQDKGLVVMWATGHFDEELGTPHYHVCGFWLADGFKQGPSHHISASRALANAGYDRIAGIGQVKKGSDEYQGFQFDRFYADFRKMQERDLKQLGYEIKEPQQKREHENVHIFKAAQAQRKEQELAIAQNQQTITEQGEIIIANDAHLEKQDERIANNDDILATQQELIHDGEDRLAEVVQELNEIEYQLEVKTKELETTKKQVETINNELASMQEQQQKLQNDIATMQATAAKIAEEGTKKAKRFDEVMAQYRAEIQDKMDQSAKLDSEIALKTDERNRLSLEAQRNAELIDKLAKAAIDIKKTGKMFHKEQKSYINPHVESEITSTQNKVKEVQNSKVYTPQDVIDLRNQRDNAIIERDRVQRKYDELEQNLELQSEIKAASKVREKDNEIKKLEKQLKSARGDIDYMENVVIKALAERAGIDIEEVYERYFPNGKVPEHGSTPSRNDGAR